MRAIPARMFIKENTMKMLPEHFEHMRAALAPINTGRPDGVTLRRYQWDLVRQAGLIPWLCDTLYKYLNDEHVQTALNRLVK